MQPQRHFSTAEAADNIQHRHASPPGLAPMHADHQAQITAGMNAALASAAAALKSGSRRSRLSHRVQSDPKPQMPSADQSSARKIEPSADTPITAEQIKAFGSQKKRAADTAPPPTGCHEEASLGTMYSAAALAARQLHLQALILFSGRDWKLASDLLRQAISLHDSDSQLHHSLAKALVHQGLPHEALQQASRAVDLQPDRRTHWLLRAYSLSKAGFHELALSEFEALAGSSSPGSTADRRRVSWFFPMTAFSKLRHKGSQALLAREQES